MESFNPNRHLKEQFVSNLTGSSKLELFFLLTNLSVLILIRRCIGFNWISSGSVKKDDNAASNGRSLEAFIVVLSIDFFCIVVPYILFLTVLAEWTYRNTIMVLLLLLCLRTFSRKVDTILSGEMSLLTGFPWFLLHASLFWLLISTYFPEDLRKQRHMELA